MKDLETQLKLQAYLDGELSGREAAEAKDWLGRDREARELLAELGNTCAALKDCELEVKLPETREFFWSKIQREIERQDAAPVPAHRVSWIAWARHHLVSLGGAALLTCVMALMLVHGSAAGQFAEMEMTSDDMGAYTFRDQQDKMTMVWFYDRSDDSDNTEPAAIASMETE